MKITVIGDTHGHTRWKDVLDIEAADSDRVVFLGDYVDSFHGTPEGYFQVLQDLIALKESDPTKYVLLLGNHDYQYYIQGDLRERYSGFSWDTADKVCPVLRDNIDLFQVMHREGDILFSHAGLSTRWIQLFFEEKSFSLDTACRPLTQDIREFYGEEYSTGLIELSSLKFNNITGFSMSGDSTGSSPIWIRPSSLLTCFYHEGISTQVVGHTPTLGGVISTRDHDDQDLWICDSLHNGSYLVIEDNIFTVKYLPEFNKIN